MANFYIVHGKQVLALLIAALFSSLGVILMSCSPKSSEEEFHGVTVSTFGDFTFGDAVLHVKEDLQKKGILYFVYSDNSGKIIASSEDLDEKGKGTASIYQKWGIVLFPDALWLSSSDIGLYHWKLDKDKGTMVLSHYETGDIPPAVVSILPKSLRNDGR